MLWTPKHRTLGFTLIEMLVVLTIIGMLAAVVSPLVFRHIEDARVTTTRAQMEALDVALETYAMDAGGYPTTTQGLKALVTAPISSPIPIAWKGPYLRKGIPLDGWSREFRYENPGRANPRSFDLWSFGRDGVAGGIGQDADLQGWGTTPQ